MLHINAFHNNCLPVKRVSVEMPKPKAVYLHKHCYFCLQGGIYHNYNVVCGKHNNNYDGHRRGGYFLILPIWVTHYRGNNTYFNFHGMPENKVSVFNIDINKSSKSQWLWKLI